MKRKIYFNGQDMGIFEVKIDGDDVFIEDKDRENEKFMSVLLRSSDTIVFVNQDTETILPTKMRINKEDIKEYLSFDLTKEEVGRQMSIIMAKGDSDV